MPRYELNKDRLTIYFDEKPSEEIQKQMDAIGIHLQIGKMCWGREFTEECLEFVKQLCGEKDTAIDEKSEEQNNTSSATSLNYGLKLKIKDVVNGDLDIQQKWKRQLKNFVNRRLSEDNAIMLVRLLVKPKRLCGMIVLTL